MSIQIKRFGKKLLSVMLCFIMLATTFFIFDPMSMVASAADVSVWDGTAANGDANIKVDGTICYIYTAKGLAYFRNNPGTYANKTVMLQADIDLNGINWGQGITGFYGIFDGCGHTISKLTITNATNQIGFFKNVTNNLTVQNVTFDKAKICTPTSHAYNWHGVVLGFTYCNQKTIKFDSVTLRDCSVYGVEGTGGLLGGCEAEGSYYNNLIINNCRFESTGDTNYPAIVESDGASTGAFIGKANAYPNAMQITDCVNFAKIESAGINAGGFIGLLTRNGCTINNSVNYGEVSSSNHYAGGFIGNTNATVTIDNCKNYGYIHSVSNTGLGGFIGFCAGGTCTIENDSINYGEVTNQGNGIGGFVGQSDANLIFTDCKNEGYIHTTGNANNQTVGGFVGTSTKTDTFTDCINNGNVTSNRTGAQNTNMSSAGGFVSYKTGSVTFNHCYNTGTITAYYGVGGLGGDMNCPVYITNSYNLGTIAGKTSGYGYAGGLVGIARGLFQATKCFNGNGVGGDIGNSSVKHKNAGGLLGYVNGASTISSCYNNAPIYATGNVGGIIGEACSTVTASYCYNAGSIPNGTRNNISSRNAPSNTGTCYYLSGVGPTGQGTEISSANLKAEPTTQKLNGGTNKYIQDVTGLNAYYPIFDFYAEDFHHIDLAGFLDGVENDTILNYGTADVYINGQLVENDCTDFYQVYPVGTTYEINDIKATNGKNYDGLKVDSNGWHNGLTGTIEKTSPQVMGARLAFLTNYTIGYELSGGSVSTPNPTIYNVETASFTLNNPTRAGYNFTGWTGSNGSTAQTSVSIAQGSTGDKAYTANWDIINYNIAYNLDGGTVATANPTSYNVETGTFTLNNPTKTGYTFAGWTGSNGTTAQTSVSIAQGSTGNKSYTANWTINSYTVTFKNYDGSTLYSDNFDYGTMPAYNGETPARAADDNYKYTFSGWDRAIETVTGETSYTAQYTQTAHIYTYESISATEHRKFCATCTHDAGIEEHEFEYRRIDSSTNAYVCAKCGYTEEIEATQYTVTVPSTCQVVQALKPTLSNSYFVATIEAPQRDGNKYFVYWTDGDGNIVSTYYKYSFFVVKSVSLTPVYATQEDYYTERDRGIIVSRVADIRDNGDGQSYSILAEHSVAKSVGTITGHGVLYTTDVTQKDLLTVGNDNVENKQAGLSSRTLTGLLEVTIDPGAASTVWARTYVLDSENNPVYGDVKAVSVNSTTASTGEEPIILSTMSFDCTELNELENDTVNEPVEEPTEEPTVGKLLSIWQMIVMVIERIFSIFKGVSL